MGTHDSDNVGDSGGRMRDMRENVLPILEAAGVDVVLAGHSHIFERSFLVDGAYDTPTTAPGHIIDDGNGFPESGPYTKPAGLDANQGAVYVVAGHGGISVGGAGNHPLMFFSEVANGSCLLTINANVLTISNIRSDGVDTDSVRIVKLGGPGDFDSDGDVDNDDYVIFAGCIGGPEFSVPPRGCTELHFELADVQADNDVDLRDYSAVVASFSAR